MVNVKIDMTGWNMWEHGVLESRLTVIKQVEDYIYVDKHDKEHHEAQWLCKCNCTRNNIITVRQSYLKNGHTTSCGCVSRENASKRWVGNTYGTNLKKENKKDLSGDYGIIWSTNTNEEIYFDLEDADKILEHTWMIGTRGYPVAHIDNKTITMHVFLGYRYYDHKDRNKLNNRKSNLRQASASENIRNKGIQSNNTSGFIGVSWNKKSNKYEAYIKPEEKRIRLGYFVNIEDAVRARLHAEAKYFGEFAPQRHLFEQYGIAIQN